MIGLALGLTIAIQSSSEPIAAVSLSLLTGFAAYTPDLDIKLGISHRGITHSLLAVVALALLVWHVAPTLLVYIVGGYVSHLLADMLTVSGIQLFFPFKWRLNLLRLRTGGVVDRLIGLCASVMMLWLLGDMYGLIPN